MDKKVIHTVFEAAVLRYADKTAVETGYSSISYSVLNCQANRLAHLLQFAGCEAGTIINVVAPSSIETVTAVLGVFKCGGIYLPVDLSFAEKRLRQVFSETFDGILVVSASMYEPLLEMMEKLAVKPRHLVVLQEDHSIQLYSASPGILQPVAFAETTEWADNLPQLANGDSSNYIFYTSGSTGEGKAILGAHAGLSHFVHWEIKEFSITEQFRISLLAQVTFDASLRDIFTALIAGGTLCIPGTDIRNNPAKLLQWMEESRLTLIHCVPSVFRLLVKELQSAGTLQYNFQSLRYILMAGELLYAKDIINWRKHAGEQITLVNLYGATETTLVKTFYRIGAVPENPAQIIPAGVPISNTAVAIVKDGQLCKVGEIGELYIKTPFMTKGYYRNQELTAESFVQNPLLPGVKDIVYKSGDLGRYLPDGNIEVLGRLDSQVKVNGIRIELGEIERAILESENITGAVVKTHRTDDNLLTLVAYYTGEKTEPEAFQQKLSKTLNRPMIPSYFIYLEEFPLNINGKVDKKALPLPEDILTGADNYEAPEGDTENKLADFWKEILGLKKIGRNISFFSVGGHSLRAIQLVARIQSEMGISLKIADIFTNRTIREQALLLGNSQQTTAAVIERAPVQPHYPLSSAQRRLWILSQLEESNIAYNMPAVFRLQGELDIQSLEESFRSLISRHEILRTVFKEDETGTVRQFIHSATDMLFSIPVTDLRGTENAEKILATALQQFCSKAFSLDKGPLLRACLYQQNDREWIFAYTMHHIISDGWSMRLLPEELMQWYAVHSGIGAVTPATLRIQYKDYAVWQQEQLEAGQLREEKEYWLQQFADEIPVLAFPTDKPRPPVKTFNGGLVTRTINNTLTTKLKSFCGEQGGTLFMGLLTTLNILLHRYTGQEDIIIGSPVAGRSHAELEDQLGCYLNTIALRSRFSGDENYKELFAGIKRLTLDAFSHQSYPFDDLVHSLGRQHDLSRNPLFDVTLALQNTERASAENNTRPLPITISSNDADIYTTSKFDLTFNFAETGDTIELGLEYNNDLFTEATAERIAAHLEQLLAAGLTNTSVAVNELDYLSDEEKDQLLNTFNDTAISYPANKSIISLFAEQAAQTPDRKALGFENTVLTYRELNEKANQLAGYIKSEFDLEPGDRAGIKLERSEWLIIAVLAVLKCGATYVPLDTEYPEERLLYMQDDCACKLVVDEAILSGFRRVSDVYSASNPETSRSADSYAYIMYTSGSTGLPKGVMVKDRSITRLVKPGRYASLTGNESILSTGSFSFDATTFEYWAALLNGGYVRLCRQEVLLDTGMLKKEIRENGIDTMWFTAGWFNQLVDTDLTIFEGLKTVLAGGDKLSVNHIHLLCEKYRGLKIINGYGPTENTTFSLTCPLTYPAPDLIPVGKPIDNSFACILDKKGKLVPAGVFGEIVVGGDGLSAGYLNNPVLTHEKFIANPFAANSRLYKTGDLGRWLPDGNIEFGGRADDQLKIRGYRVEPGEIENVLQQYEGVQSALVVAKQGEGEEKNLIAYIVTNGETEISAIRNYLESRLPSYMVPHYFVELDTLPLTSNGKVNRRELPDPDELHTEYATPYIPPQNEIQQQLVEVYQEVLKKKPVSIKENFFVLGGDSIKSIQIVSKLKQRGYTLAIRDILSHPVIEELEQYVNKSTRAAEQGATEGLIPLSPIQTAFLQNDFSLKYHYNQSVLLQSSEPVSPEGIRMALNKIVQHHDILRAVFRKEETGWIQENRGEGQYYSFEIIENADDELFIAHCERIQSTASLAEGPLFRVCLFRNQGADRLLMVIHHLLVDGVSWRILFEDLAALYNQYLQGQPLVLPPKTDSFRYWMQQQAAYATSPDLQQQEEYWSAIESGSYAPLPADNPEGLNTAGDAVTISFALDNETTERLLTGCYQAYRTDVNDILLTAFGLSLREIFDPGKVLIKMEGHGREDTGMNTDVSRTVGWFTTTYPVVLNMEYSSDIIRQLIEIKETLHRVPEKGLGYGVLRYLANKNYKLEPQITFNYLGDFGTGVHAKGNHQLFTFSGGYHGKDMPDSLQRDAMLDITGIIAGKELQLSITYSKEQYGTATMENLSGCFRKKLETLVQLLSAEKKQQLSPVDLTWNKLTVEQVNKLNKLGLEDVYPLSPLQLGLYYHWLSEPDSPVYVQQISYRLKGSLAIAAVEKSYQELIARHAMLRTCFSHEWSDRPLQMVFNKTASSFEYNDATGKAELSPAWFKKADQAKGFNLHSGTQMRLTVLKLENAVHEFVWTFHHIIMDGWSVARLMTEFFEIYRNTTSGITEGPAEMNSYANYISWLEKKDKTLSLDYWTDYLTGYDTVACIPRLPGNKRKGYRGEKLTLEISGNKREALRRRCAGEGITENNFFLALWGLLLGKYNNTTDVVFGTVVSGRATEVRGVENIVGLFINTIPVRVKTGEEITLQNLLRNVQKESVDAGAHHYVQLAELQSRSELGRNLFDHIVVFENYPVQEVIDKSVGDQHTGERLEVTAVQLAEQSSYDFFITIVPGKNIEVNFNYNACVLGEMQLQRLQEHFDQLITLALKDKGQLVKNCTYTSEGEEQLLLHTFNDTAHPYRANQTLVSLFEEQVAAAPDREILKFDKVSLTFRELNETANQLSAYLRKQYGVQPDDRVCIKLERSEWMIIAILGVLKSGGAYVPVDPAYPEERIAYMLGDSNSKVLLDEKELQHFRKQQAQYSKENQQLISRPSGLAYIIYTSGSTGRPKGCMLEHGSIVNRLQWMWEQYGFTKEDVILQKTTFTFDVSVWELFLPLCYGATMVLCHREDIAVPERIVSLIRQHKVSCMHFVPSMMNAFTGNLFERDTIGEELQSLRLIITSGEALPVQTLKNWYAKVPVPVHNLYGPTEASVDVSFYATSPTDEMVLIGKPVWNTQLYITGQDGQLQSPGIPGEICIAGVGLARGYINNPELTTEKFVNNPFRPGTKMYRTGDIGRWLEDGNIEYIGRKDGQVKIRGHRVETGEVEAVLLDHPDIESCVVTVQSSGGNVNELRACIVSRTLLNIVELRQWLSNKLPLYMIPAQFIQLEQLPLTASGKADRKALQQLPVQTLQAGVEYIPARNETEELLSSIWRQLLGERQISITENFFDAGGDSIRLIELSGLVSRAIGKEISIPVLFQYPTISDLAAYLANETKAYDVPDYDRTELMDDISKFS